MSLHRSLKTTSGALEAHRNVLTRAERIRKLMSKDEFDAEEGSPIGLPKVRNIKVMTKKKKTAKEDEAGAEGAAGEASPASE